MLCREGFFRKDERKIQNEVLMTERLHLLVIICLNVQCIKRLKYTLKLSLRPIF